MTTKAQPTKQRIREWMHTEVAAHRPPPSPERIREMLGWKLIHPKKKR